MSNGQQLRLACCYATFAFLTLLLPARSHAADVPDALTAGWKGEKRCEKLYQDEQIRVLRCTFPPNVGHEAHSHPASFSYFLSGGHGRVTDSHGTREFETKTDDFRVGKPVEWHEMVNVGDSMQRYLIVEKKYETEK
jgi:quercetin dioxygenase-like cupin family protein